MSKQLNKKGFTLIEVVLAIAIGALIFLLAFIAFRNAQVNRRDSQRRSDLDKISAEINNYASDHNGSVPAKTGFFTASTGFLATYAGPLTDPSDGSTTYVKINVTDSNGTTDDNGAGLKSRVGSINYASITGAGTNTLKPCDEEKPDLSTKNSYVVRMRLEKGIACRDSSTN